MRGFSLNTKVLLVSKEWKEIKDLAIGEELLCFNEDLIVSKIKNITSYKESPVLIKGMISNTICFNEDFLAYNRQWVNSKDLLNSVLLYFTRCNFSRDKYAEEIIIGIESLPEQELVHIQCDLPILINGGLIIRT